MQEIELAIIKALEDRDWDRLKELMNRGPHEVTVRLLYRMYRAAKAMERVAEFVRETPPGR